MLQKRWIGLLHIAFLICASVSSVPVQIEANGVVKSQSVTNGGPAALTEATVETKSSEVIVHKNGVNDTAGIKSSESKEGEAEKIRQVQTDVGGEECDKAEASVGVTQDTVPNEDTVEITVQNADGKGGYSKTNHPADVHASSLLDPSATAEHEALESTKGVAVTVAYSEALESAQAEMEGAKMQDDGTLENDEINAYATHESRSMQSGNNGYASVMSKSENLIEQANWKTLQAWLDKPCKRVNEMPPTQSDDGSGNPGGSKVTWQIKQCDSSVPCNSITVDIIDQEADQKTQNGPSNKDDCLERCGCKWVNSQCRSC